jgi:nucleoside-diphosphate-sugar epimerase
VGEHPFVEDPPAGESARARTERAVLAGGGIVIRPGLVYGRGGGIPAEMVGWARAHGTGRHVGPADTRWPTVHVDDLADLYLLVLAGVLPDAAGAPDPAVPAGVRAGRGGILHGAGEDGVRVGDIAAAADIAAGGPGRAEEWPVAEAATEIGARYAESLALDQVLSSTRTRDGLGWSPARPGIVQELTESAAYRVST